MNELSELFANNRRWAGDVKSRQPGFFAGLAAQQAPRYLWIGCLDSRVPANEIVGLAPGELFVHSMEGITVWDLDDNRAPSVSGQVHVVWLDAAAVIADDIVISHFRVPADERAKV